MLLLPMLSIGCASAQTGPSAELMLDSQGDLQSIVTQPFNDFNLVRTEIPEKLQSLADAPYAAAGPQTCEGIAAEISELDGLLGPDMEVQGGASRQPIVGMASAEKTARGAARSAASSWIPFRGFVRELTGAERHSRAVKEAVLAGLLRRAYLKGSRESLRCPIPVSSADSAATSSAAQ